MLSQSFLTAWEQLQEEIATEIATELTVQHIPYIIKYDVDTTTGSYNNTFKVVKINVTTTFNLDTFISTCLHEYRHAWQSKTNQFTEYTEVDFDSYMNCPAEKDARHYEAMHRDRFYAKYFNKYHDLLDTLENPSSFITDLIVYHEADFCHSETGECITPEWVSKNYADIFLLHQGNGHYYVITTKKYDRLSFEEAIEMLLNN